MVRCKHCGLIASPCRCRRCAASRLLARSDERCVACACMPRCPAASPQSVAPPAFTRVACLQCCGAAPVRISLEGQTDEDLLHLLAHDTGALCLLCYALDAAPRFGCCARCFLLRMLGGFACCCRQASCASCCRVLACKRRLPKPTHSPADSFNRWEAGHILAKKLMRSLYAAAKASNEVRGGSCFAPTVSEHSPNTWEAGGHTLSNLTGACLSAANARMPD